MMVCRRRQRTLQVEVGPGSATPLPESSVTCEKCCNGKRGLFGHIGFGMLQVRCSHCSGRGCVAEDRAPKHRRLEDSSTGEDGTHSTVPAPRAIETIDSASSGTHSTVPSAEPSGSRGTENSAEHASIEVPPDDVGEDGTHSTVPAPPALETIDSDPSGTHSTVPSAKSLGSRGTENSAEHASIEVPHGDGDEEVKHKEENERKEREDEEAFMTITFATEGDLGLSWYDPDGLIEAVESHGLAFKAGVKKGWWIKKINNEVLTSDGSLARKMLCKTRPNEIVISFWTEGKEDMLNILRKYMTKSSDQDQETAVGSSARRNIRSA